MIVYINDADLEMLDTCICKSLLSRVVDLNVLSTELDKVDAKSVINWTVVGQLS